MNQASSSHKCEMQIRALCARARARVIASSTDADDLVASLVVLVHARAFAIGEQLVKWPILARCL